MLPGTLLPKKFGLGILSHWENCSRKIPSRSGSFVFHYLNNHFNCRNFFVFFCCPQRDSNFRTKGLYSSVQAEEPLSSIYLVLYHVVAPRFTCLQDCIMQQPLIRRGQSQYSSSQVHMSLGLYHVVASSQARLELVQQFLGSHVSRFVPRSSSKPDEVKVSLVVRRITCLLVCTIQQLFARRSQSQYSSSQVHMSRGLYHMVAPCEAK